MSETSYHISLFQGDRLPDLGDLLLESSEAGLKSLQRLESDWTSGQNRFQRPGESFFVAWGSQTIVGVCGLNIDPYTESSQVGRVRRLYVLQSARRQGIGRALVETVIRQAKYATLSELRVRVGNPASNGFFLRLGFTAESCALSYTHRLILQDQTEAS